MPLEYFPQSNSAYNPNTLGSPYYQPQPQQQPSSSGSGFSIPNIPSGIFNPSSITSSINSFGTGLGFAPGTVTYPTTAGIIGPSLPGASAIGPFAPSTGVPVAGSAGTTATLSGTLGAAGIGALAGNFLGKIGGNETGGSIGGGAGAGIGFAVGGPVGGVIGGLIGGIGGGFFGNKKPSNKQQNGIINLATGEYNAEASNAASQQGKKFSADNAKVRDSLSSGTSNFTKYLLSQGATPKTKEGSIAVGFGSRDGYAANINGKVLGSKDYKSFSNMAYQEIINQYNIPYSLQAQLNDMNKDDISNFGGSASSGSGNGQAGGGSVRATPYAIGPRGTGKKTFEQFYTEYKKTKSQNII